ncbi:NB-ARC domain-containing protein [Saccharopolyspora taberi]|uniref:AAA+ ATPase domain-containing protein n=1 Tax=Saccharopolyspora taberi TaxID=60895 RepID=A0ABN3V8N8_9PSEU
MHNENHGDVRNLVQAGVAHVHLPDGRRTPGDLPTWQQVLVDRVSEQARLMELLTGDGSVTCVGISGTSGVGKSALALYCLNRVVKRFEHGQLYYDFNAQGRPVGLVDAVRYCLKSLGGQVPVDPGEAAARLRSELSERRVVVVLDNIAELDGLRELRPSTGSLLLFTTHRNVDDLRFDGVEPIALDVFDLDSGVELLEKLCPDGRVAREPDAARELVELCGFLPVALRIVGGMLVKRKSRRLSALVAELRNDDVRHARMRNTLKHVVEDLSPGERDLYLLLGLVPGPTFSAPAAAALADLLPHVAEELLDELRTSNLLEENDREQFRFHDLVGLHAKKLAEAEFSHDAARAARLRLVEWYRTQGAFADRAVTEPSRLRVGGDDDLVAGANPFDKTSGLEWLENERPNILALAELCAEYRWDEAVISFCDGPLWALHNHHKNYRDTLAALKSGVGAAERAGDLRAEARMRSLRVQLWTELASYDAARDEAALAVAAAERSGNRRILASALEFQGKLHLAEESWDDAIALFRQALALNEEVGRPRGMAIQHYLIGKALNGRGDHEESFAHLDVALGLLAGFPDERRLPGRVRLVIASGHQQLGWHSEAVELLREVVDQTRARNASFELAEALELLGISLAETGDSAASREHLTEALDIYRQAGHPAADRVLRRLG